MALVGQRECERAWPPFWPSSRLRGVGHAVQPAPLILSRPWPEQLCLTSGLIWCLLGMAAVQSSGSSGMQGLGAGSSGQCLLAVCGGQLCTVLQGSRVCGWSGFGRGRQRGFWGAVARLLGLLGSHGWRARRCRRCRR